MTSLKVLVAFFAAICLSIQAQTITFYSFGDNFAPHLIEQFTKQTGIKVEEHNFGSTSEIDAHLRSAEAIDVAIVPHLLLKNAISEKLLVPLNYELLPNSKNIQTNISKKLNKVDPNNKYAIAFMHSATIIAVNRFLAEQAYGDKLPNSWDLVFDLKTVQKLAKCGIGFMDEPIDAVAAVLNYMGVTIRQTTEGQLTKAGDLLASLKPYIKTVGAPYRDEFKKGELCLALTRTPDLGEEIAPDEGIFMTIETAIISAKSSNIAAAHQFIDFFLQPEIAATNLSFSNFPIANNGVKKIVSQELAANHNLFPTEKDISLAHLLPNFSKKSIARIKHEFDKVKK